MGISQKSSSLTDWKRTNQIEHMHGSQPICSINYRYRTRCFMSPSRNMPDDVIHHSGFIGYCSVLFDTGWEPTHTPKVHVISQSIYLYGQFKRSSIFQSYQVTKWSTSHYYSRFPDDNFPTLRRTEMTQYLVETERLPNEQFRQLIICFK